MIGFLLIVSLSSILWLILPGSEPVNRIRYTLSWSALFALPLLVGIYTTLFQRFGSEDYIKGYAASNELSFSNAYLSNTVEQTMFNVLAALTLGMVAPISYIKLVPIQALIFVFGWMLYFFTYKNNPMQRFVGFVVGYYVAIASVAASIYWSIESAYNKAGPASRLRGEFWRRVFSRTPATALNLLSPLFITP